MSCNLCGTAPTWLVYLPDAAFGAWPVIRCRRCTLDSLLRLEVVAVDGYRFVVNPVITTLQPIPRTTQ